MLANIRLMFVATNYVVNEEFKITIDEVHRGVQWDDIYSVVEASLFNELYILGVSISLYIYINIDYQSLSVLLKLLMWDGMSRDGSVCT